MFSPNGTARWRVAALGLVAMVASVLATSTTAAAQTDGATCDGQAATIEGSGVIEGTPGNDVIVGSDGVDLIIGRGGDDIICGLSGRDVIRAGAGDDTVFGGGGVDIVEGGAGDDFLAGGPKADRLYGGNGDDDLRGGAGNDQLNGGSGRDHLYGGPADDVLNGGNATDRMFGGRGSDTLIGDAGSRDRLFGGSGVDQCSDGDAGTSEDSCETSLSLTFLHMNDHHSHLDDDSGDLILGGDETRVRLGGFPSAVAKMAELEAAAANEVVKVHAGDAITGTLFYSLFDGVADAALMNEICFDLFTLGNHEFDDGDQALADFIAELQGADDCTTEVISANVMPAVGTPLLPFESNPAFQPYVIKNFDGEKVGFVGLDIAGKTKNSSNPLDTTEFADEAETAEATIAVLEGLGVDKIVLVTHIQYANDLVIAESVAGVDVIIGGDSHTLLGDFEDLGQTTGGDYPTMVSGPSGDVCVVQAWQFSWAVGELDVTWDADGNIASCEGTPHVILGDSFQRRPPEGGDREELTGDDLAAVLADIAAIPELSIVTPDADAQALLDSFSDQVEQLEQEVIGTVTEDLCLERIPGQGRSSICDVSATAVNGGDIQQLVTESFRVRSRDADIALQNAGGVRIDIPAGEMTIADAYTLLPFANTIVNMEMTGAEIVQVLEEALTFSLDPDGSTGAYPYASGLRFDVDLSAAEGSRATNHEVKPTGTDEWVAIDLEATYKVATNSFIAAGRDGYLTFGTVSDDGRVEDTLLDYAQSFIDYVEDEAGGTLSKLPTSEYSTQSFVPAPAAE